MKNKALFAYAVLLVLVFAARLPHGRVLGQMLPLYLLAVPLMLQRRINFSFSSRHALLGVAVSAAVLLPFSVLVHGGLRPAQQLTAWVLLLQLLAVAFPEEVFFRGFLQEALGNTFSAVIISSGLFAIAHLPLFIFHGDIYSLMTFFPSLVMGLLYQRTSNILPGVVFHFFANVLFFGFMI